MIRMKKFEIIMNRILGNALDEYLRNKGYRAIIGEYCHWISFIPLNGLQINPIVYQSSQLYGNEFPPAPIVQNENYIPPPGL